MFHNLIGAFRRKAVYNDDADAEYTNQSTAVMENLHTFAAQGCTMQGLCTITRHENRWGDEEPTEVMGIRFSVN